MASIIFTTTTTATSATITNKSPLTTTTAITTTKPACKRPGPPVPPRPQHAASAMKTAREPSTCAISTVSTIISATTTTAAATTPTPTAEKTIAAGINRTKQQQQQQRQQLASPSSSSVSQEQPTLLVADSEAITRRRNTFLSESAARENCALSVTTLTTLSATTTAAATTTRPTIAIAGMGSRPPLKLRKAPEAPKPKLQTIATATTTIHVADNNNATAADTGATSPVAVVAVQTESKFSASKFIANFTKKRQSPKKQNNNNNNNSSSNIALVPASNGININRHNSLYTPKTNTTPPTIAAKDTRHSLGKADTDRVPLSKLPQPLPKPRSTLISAPITANASLRDADNTSLPIVVQLRRSKTTMDAFGSRVITSGTGGDVCCNGAAAAATTIAATASTSSTTSTRFVNSFLGGKTAELKNNLKNAAERLLGEIRNTQSCNITPPLVIKHEAILLQQSSGVSNEGEQHMSDKDEALTPSRSDNDNCTRINIGAEMTRYKCQTLNNMQQQQEQQQLQSSVDNKKGESTSFPEILISEIAAMRAKSSSMDNLQQLYSSSTMEDNNNVGVIAATITAEKQLVENPNDTSKVVEQLDELKTRIISSTKSTPRKRIPSAGSTDSSPYGSTERSATRIRTSDWVEVGDNGKQVTLTSCQISLEDSGLEDEERLDDMSSSGVGDSWDSVKEAEKEERCRSAKRLISPTSDLPPLPKSLSGINQMLGSDSGLLSDIDLFQNGNEPNAITAIAAATTITTTTATAAPTTNIPNCQMEKSSSNNNNNKESNDNENDVQSNVMEETDHAIKNTTTTTTAPIKASTLDTQLAILRKEMYGLRQLDLSLLSQLWALNDSIQEFRSMLQEHTEEVIEDDGDGDVEEEEEEDREGEDEDVEMTEGKGHYDKDSAAGKVLSKTLTQKVTRDITVSRSSRSPSPYDNNSISSEAEDELVSGGSIRATTTTTQDIRPKIITTQPRLNKSGNKILPAPIIELSPDFRQPLTETAINAKQIMAPTFRDASSLKIRPMCGLQKPAVPRPLEHKPTMPRMRSAPPPPPTVQRKCSAPSRPST